MFKLFVISGLFVLLSASEASIEPKCEYCIDNHCYVDAMYKAPYLHRYGKSNRPAFDMTESLLYTTRKGLSVNIDMVNFRYVRGKPYYPVKRNPTVEVTNVMGHAVDQKTRKVYIWADKQGKVATDSIYDPVTKTSVKVNFTTEQVKEMHFKERLYYTLKDKPGMFVYNDGASTVLPAFEGVEVNNFIIDKLEDIYAVTKDGLYRLKKDGAELILFKSGTGYWVTVDVNEDLYVLHPESKTVFILSYYVDRIAEVGAIDTLNNDRFIFDKHSNIMYYGTDLHDEPRRFAWMLIVPSGECNVELDSEGKKKIVKIITNL